ncbi:MAG: DUF393 domain-containing protein [Gammaproteobacteria bacterium]|nr:DUF393 domain-containing protein [Gammaproteobacteria bacterium]
MLYDGACPLCSREIAHYRRREGACGVTWVDLSDIGPGRETYGITYDDAMAQFHVRDRQGQWQRGGFAFVELWHHLHGYRVVGTTVRRLRLTPLLDRAYRHFARWRMRRSCQQGACTPAPNPTHRAGAAVANAGNMDKPGETRCR